MSNIPSGFGFEIISLAKSIVDCIDICARRLPAVYAGSLLFILAVAQDDIVMHVLATGSESKASSTLHCLAVWTC